MKQKIVLIIAIFTSLFVYGQDMNYSQFYHNKALLNPAYAGLSKSFNVAGIHRNQWIGIGEGNLFQSSAFILDYGISERNSSKYGSGLGSSLIYKRSVTGTSYYTTDEFRFNLSSDAPRIGKEKHGFMAQFPVGISIGYLRQRYDFHNLVFSDQLDPVTGIHGSGAGLPAEIINQTDQRYLDVGFGGMIGMKFHKTNKNPSYISLGFSYNSFYQLAETRNKDYELPNKWSIHSFYHQPISSNMLGTGIIFQKQGNLEQLILGTEFMPGNNFSFGLWLRSKNHKMNFGHYSDLIISMAYRHNSFSVGYTYDMTVSRLTNSSSKGIHEISVKVHLFNDQQRRVNKRRENNTCFFHSLY